MIKSFREYEIVANGLDFPEGPVVMADGSVIVVEIHGGRVTRCWDGRKEVIRQSADGPNGAAIGPDGALYLCHNGGAAERGHIARLDLATGRSERLYDSCDGMPLSAPNDLIFDGDGNIWFTDLGKMAADGKEFGGLYCARPDGSAITRIRGKAISYNGVGLSPDMATVYVSDTYQARIYAFDRRIEPQAPRYVATVPGFVLLDSMAVTQAGDLCVATLMEGGITTVTPQGQLRSDPIDDAYVTNIAFGGSDMREAWITCCEKGQLIRVKWDEPGLSLQFNL